VITYQVETWASYFASCQTLWVEHYDEIAGDKERMPMRPDAALFEQLERAGQLQIVTARDAGIMVGYMLFVVRPHPHYADVLCGFEDAYFMSIGSRRGTAGIKLIRESISVLKRRGVKRVFIHTKKAQDLGRILTFLGLSHSDEIYSGWIGD
jgi:hypothetical protein